MDLEMIKRVLIESAVKPTRLVVFDFDGTLIRTPEDSAESREYYEKKTGEKWPSKGWWSRPESLDMEIFPMDPIKSVLNAYHKESSESNTMVIMLTGRLKKLSNEVEAVLTKKGLKFDGYFYNTGGSTLSSKKATIEGLLDENSSISELVMYDDRNEHIPEFKKWGDELVDNKIIDKYVLYHVNDGITIV